MIDDPDYARTFTKARCTAWSNGYALAVHGSATRDLDLLAVPWMTAACDPKSLMDKICYRCGLTCIGTKEQPHGRMTSTLVFGTENDCRWIDLSIFPPSN